MDKETVKKWFSQRENQLLFLLLVFTIANRLYFFFKLGAQPIWWDEADYLGIAKVWALNQATPVWWASFTGIRPLLMPIIWAGLFKVGLTEIAVRLITLIIPSILTIYLVYALGRDFFNARIGLIAGTLMSTYWVFSFYGYRLLTDIPATFFGVLCVYLFWSVYLMRNKNWGLYTSVVAGVAAFSIRFPLSLVLISIAIYLLFVRKFSILKDKTIWKALGIGILCLIPYIAYFFYSKFALFHFYFGAKAVTVHSPMAWGIIFDIFSFIDPATLTPNQPFYMHIWAVAAILGILSLYKLVLGFDIFLKQKDNKFNSDFFLVMFLFVHLVFYIMIFRGGSDRWILMLMPPIFILSAKGLMLAHDFIKQYNKEIALLFVLVILLGGAYENFNHGNTLIDGKKDSYLQIKLVGEWLKQNTPIDTKIITTSSIQTQYYSERQNYPLFGNNSGLDDCWDVYGALSTNSSCQNETEKRFNEEIKKLKPDYFIISVFEPVFTPQWGYTYPQRYNLTFVQGYSDSNGQPMLALYKFNK